MAGTKQSQGFSVIAGIIAILVVALLGVSGWYIWHKNHKDTSKHPSSSSSTPTDINSQTGQQGDPSEGGKYLVIKEWNVRLPLSDELRGDVQYGIYTFNSGDQAAYFASKKLAAKSTGNACVLTTGTDSSGHGTSGGTLAISRSATKPDETGLPAFEQSNYWYTIEPSNGGACYNGDTGQEKGHFNTLLEAALKNLSPIQ